ncbi:MAG: hypothetical protein WC554_01045 [Clostridia bacterium]|jgi:hypothetical protein
MNEQNNNEIGMQWGREGLHVERGRREIAVLDCYDLAVLHITYGDNLDTTPEGWYKTKRERVLDWLRQTNGGRQVCQGGGKPDKPI